MKTTKLLFFELMSDSKSERWNEFELSKLSPRELLALQLLGKTRRRGSSLAVLLVLLEQTTLSPSTGNGRLGPSEQLLESSSMVPMEHLFLR
jgi:hypothetical protein